MALTVVVRSFAGAELEESLTFDGARIVIGRSAGADVRLPDPTASLRHASIRAQGSDYALVDEGSTTGTWLDGAGRLARDTPQVLRSGDLVRIGRAWLEVLIDPRPPTPDLASRARALTLALLRSTLPEGPLHPRVRVIEGPDAGVDVVLDEEDSEVVFRERIGLVRRGGAVYVRTPDDREQLWRPDSTMRIAGSVLDLEDPVGEALAALDTTADEPLDEAAAPAPPPTSVPSPTPAPPPSRVEEAPAPPLPAAAMASVPEPRPRRRAWRPFDIAMALLALAIIGASIAGLLWVLR